MTHARLSFSAALCALAFSSVACSSTETPASTEDTGGEDTGSDDTGAVDSSTGDTGATDTGKTDSSVDTGTPTDTGVAEGGGDADADTAEVSLACPTPGATGTGPCGKCGTHERLCGSDKIWLPWGACTGETGVCELGTTRDTKCGKCGTRKDTCNATCDWDNGVCTGEGICNEGDVETQYSCSTPKLVKTRTCTSTCTWSDWSACAASKGWDTMADPPTNFYGRYLHSAVWTGTDMIVYGGYNSGSPYCTFGSYNYYCGDAAAYKPSTDTWTMLPSTAIQGRYRHTAVMAGSEMIVWGGSGGASTYMADGASYNTTSGTWTTLPTVTATPSTFAGRYGHTAVWSGTEMIIFGGYNGSYLNTGAAYNASTKIWRQISTTGAPSGRYNHSAVYAGGKMIVFGGTGSCGSYCADAYAYDPAANTWTTLASPSLDGRYYATGTNGGATGNTAIFFGGYGAYVSPTYTKGDGAIYDPTAGTWTTIPAPADTLITYPKRYYHAAWWGSGQFWYWGGNPYSISYSDTGASYNPSTGTWKAMGSSGAPTARYYHTAVWDGSEAIIWGGSGSASSYLRDGKIYRP